MKLICTLCNREYPPDLTNGRCSECDEPLEVRDPVEVDKGFFETPRSGDFVERFAPFYRFIRRRPDTSLGEGGTSLLRMRETLGLRVLWVKNETENPTWTFKDRGTYTSILNAISLGYTRIGTLSSGNMGASVAAFAGRAGIDAFVILKGNVPQEKIDAITIYGAKVIRVEGDYGAAYGMTTELGGRHRIYFSVADEPMRVEGYKSVAFELFEQTRGRPPDYVATPVGAGGLIRGVLKGFEELRAAGFIDRIPKFIGVQSAGCSPTVDAFERGDDRIESFADANTLDHVLENPLPPSGNEVARKLRAQGGLLLKATNEEVLESQRLLAKQGVFAQPAGATGLAGLAQAVRAGKVPADVSVACVVTGCGLKYPPVVRKMNLPCSTTTVEGLADTVAKLGS